MLIFESNGISAFIYSTSSAMQQTEQKKKKKYNFCSENLTPVCALFLKANKI